MENLKIKTKKAFGLNSYAKINLFLDINKKLENGYHDITTLFTEVDLYDKIKFSLTNNAELKIMSNIDNLNNQDNLIYKVGIFIKDRYSVQCGANIELKKNIPIAAGLGGGSSNAATTIKGLSKLWNLNLSITDMHEIASKFGSDINFFLEGFTALGENRGEKITKLNDIYIENILLINPNFPISSKEAYDLAQINKHNSNLSQLLKTQNPVFCFNKLEEGISKKYPTIRQTLNLLKDLGAKNAILSGSGATMIAFFNDPNTCIKAQKLISKQNFWSYITSTRRRQTNEHHRR
ncbi:MAG: 4-(cytidine 5'-diphospho)-2-C-methyl-D-erythritol kinase [Candidatus Cloacimonetes bacterium]|jgi:4-diphosphocytidyl-2-C-methyl-D-erythritol kinase|nr:4-(cytidine 5'-diphospho)-2-C-methyl-D-erythritol kinase [Candidatus Cloacimonadota bacterium]MDD4154967.1 4-(cytidine 5'-diphospho)-2-C-methyl-D-erythritol kinase [Candidatus Cloacimonadota bacterium]